MVKSSVIKKNQINDSCQNGQIVHPRKKQIVNVGWDGQIFCPQQQQIADVGRYQMFRLQMKQPYNEGSSYYAVRYRKNYHGLK